MAERIPDEALVVRGGQNRPEDIERGMGTHPSGLYGLSLECSAALTVEELAASVVVSGYGKIGVTTVGDVRAAGGDVIKTPGVSPTHATLVGLTPEQASQLLTPPRVNPSKRPKRRRSR